MRTNSISVHEISFYTGKNEICLKGRMHQDQFTYDTSMFISSTQLNKVINELQKQNEDLDVSGSFSVCQDPDGNKFMWLDSANWNKSTVPVEIFVSDEKQLRIRA